jgi:hypothetical protein
VISIGIVGAWRRASARLAPDPDLATTPDKDENP